MNIRQGKLAQQYKIFDNFLTRTMIYRILLPIPAEEESPTHLLVCTVLRKMSSVIINDFLW